MDGDAERCFDLFTLFGTGGGDSLGERIFIVESLSVIAGGGECGGDLPCDEHFHDPYNHNAKISGDFFLGVLGDDS